MAQKTPFYDQHVALNAKIIDFGGFDMPVTYAGIKIEHNAVRENVGLFDVSHMGEFFVKGPQALDLLQYVTINDVSKMVDGQAQYNAMCYEDGGIVDDLLIYKMADEHYMLVVNASNIDKDYAWIAAQAPKFDCTLINESDDWCLLAVQGPAAPALMNEITPPDLDTNTIKYYTFLETNVAGQKNVILAATGYTGEKGFELYFQKDQADPAIIWNAILEAGKPLGIEPCGLGARDTLRLEKAFALYGNDIDNTTNPIEAKMGWLTKVDKGDFIGKAAIINAKANPTRKLIGFVIEERAIARHGFEVVNPENLEETIGVVTSGTMAITMEKSIGMAYVKTDYMAVGSKIAIKIRKKTVNATVVKVPFM
jgi:aminomethyltransferase